MIKNIISKEHFFDQTQENITHFIEKRHQFLEKEEKQLRFYDVLILLSFIMSLVLIGLIIYKPTQIVFYVLLLLFVADVYLFTHFRLKAKTSDRPFQRGLFQLLMAPFGFSTNIKGEHALQKMLIHAQLFPTNDVEVLHLFDGAWAYGDFSIALLKVQETAIEDDVTILSFPIDKKVPHLVIDSDKLRFIPEMKEVNSLINKKFMQEYAIFSNKVKEGRAFLTTDICRKIQKVRDAFSNISQIGNIELRPAKKGAQDLLRVPMRVAVFKGRLIFAIYGFTQLFDVTDLFQEDLFMDKVDYIATLDAFYDDMERLLKVQQIV